MLVLFLGSCTTWRPSTVSLRQVIEEEDPAQVRITSVRGDRLVVRDPEIREDSVAGTTEAYPEVEVAPSGGAFGGAVQMRADTVAVIAMAEIRQVEVRRTSISRTVLAVPLLLMAAGIITCTVTSCTPD